MRLYPQPNSQSQARRKCTDFAQPPLIGGKAESRTGVTSDRLPVQDSGTNLSPVASRGWFFSHEDALFKIQRSHNVWKI